MYIVNSRQGPKTLITATATKETDWLAALPLFLYEYVWHCHLLILT